MRAALRRSIQFWKPGAFLLLGGDRLTPMDDLSEDAVERIMSGLKAGNGRVSLRPSHLTVDLSRIPPRKRASYARMVRALADKALKESGAST